MSELAHFDWSVEGPADGQTLVFVHGWPDGPELWRGLVDVLADRYRCVLLTLPNYGVEADWPGGFDFPEVMQMFSRTIDLAQPDGKPVTLITHDWGAYLGYFFEQAEPSRVTSIIAMDVGAHLQPKMSEALMIAGYQWALACLWLLGGVWPAAGDFLTRKFAASLAVPRQAAQVARSRFNYLYFYFWRDTLLPWLRQRLLGRYRPQCPVFYIYGGNKPMMFHSPRWLSIIEAAGGRVACIEDAGHWFMLSHPDMLEKMVLDWLGRD